MTWTHDGVLIWLVRTDCRELRTPLAGFEPVTICFPPTAPKYAPSLGRGAANPFSKRTLQLPLALVTSPTVRVAQQFSIAFLHHYHCLHTSHRSRALVPICHTYDTTTSHSWLVEPQPAWRISIAGPLPPATLAAFSFILFLRQGRTRAEQ